MYDEKKGRHGRSAAADPEASLEATATEPHRGGRFAAPSLGRWWHALPTAAGA